MPFNNNTKTDIQIRRFTFRIVIVFLLAITVATGTITLILTRKSSQEMKSKVVNLIQANTQLQISNLNQYLGRIEDTAALLFSDDIYCEYDATKEGQDAFEKIQQAVAKVAPGIAQFFKELSSGKVDKKKWTEIGESIGRIAVGVVAVIAAVKGISAIFGVITTVISVVKAVISVIKLAFVVVKSIITVIKVVGAVISILASAFGPVILAIAAAIAIGVLLWKNWDKIREAAGNLLEGIKTTIGNVRDAIVSGFQAAIDWITSLPAEALKWGSDIIDGIVSGIQSAVGRVGEAVKGVADKIKSFLGFSEPEDGPLSDFHTYMPDMIDLMASGITSGKKKVKDALEGMTGEMSVIAKANVVSKATGRGATGGTTGGRTVTQNVNINNQFNGDRAGQQKSSEAMDKAAGDATGEMARALAFAK